MSAPADQLRRLEWITAQLRRYCPWTAQLTHEQLAEYLIEEAHEAVEIIDGFDHLEDADAQLTSELGDVLFQVILHSAVAADDNRFELDDVAAAISAKMIRRNPHVFTPDGELLPEAELGQQTIADIEKQWEAIKQAEREHLPESVDTATESIFHLPPAMPGLAAAGKIIDRAGRQLENPLPDVEPQTDVQQALADEDSLGQYLFDLTRAARAKNLDPERALRRRLVRLHQGMDSGR